MAWKVFAGMSLVGVVCLGVGAALAAEGDGKLPFTVSPETTVIALPLDADGTPDYIGAINAHFGRGVTPENNAFAALFDVLGSRPKDGMYVQDQLPKCLEMLGTRQTPEGQAVFEMYFNYLLDQKVNHDAAAKEESHFGDLGKYPWRRQDEPQAAAYLKAMDPLLDRAVAALEKPRWWIPLISRDGRSVLSADLPALGEFRSLAQALGARATQRLADDNFSGYLQDVQAIMRLGRDQEQSPFLITQLAGIATEVVGKFTIAGAADSGKLSAAQCEAIGKMLDALPLETTTADQVNSCERYQLLDIAALVATGNAEILLKDMGGETDDLKEMLGAIDRETVDWDAVFKQFNAGFDEEVAILRSSNVAEIQSKADTLNARIKRWSEETKASKNTHKQPAENRAAYSERVGRALIVEFFPVVDRARTVEIKGDMTQGMARVLLAAAAAKARTGKWPAKAEEMVPDDIKELPRDAYSAKGKGTEAVKYMLTANGPRVYSIGENMRDDGGVRGDGGKDDIALGGFVHEPPVVEDGAMP